MYLSDKVPELPYFIIALYFVLANTDSGFIHFFSAAFWFMMLTLLVGVGLKLCFRTQRPKPYHSRYVLFRYGFPSLHSMISIGALAFVYHIDPFLSLLLLPIGVFYIYARIHGGFHTREDVLGGVIIGVALGSLTGSLIGNVFFPAEAEFLFAFLLFVIPVTASIARVKELI